jgi:hypothetical protein
MNFIINDPGGNLGDHVMVGKILAASKATLAVKYCASACLFMLSMVPHNQVCVYSDAWIGMHSAARKSVYVGESTTTMIWQRGIKWALAKGYRTCSFAGRSAILSEVA